VRRLAEEIIAGAEDDAERAASIASHLQRRYTYALQGMTRIGPDPVAWFLLQARQGHCEYFAGGMVVLLEAVGVPARMVGGYSGGAPSPAGDEVVVRESNAHTWVEVWLGPEHGWAMFDPTPAAGVPELGGAPARLRLQRAWEWLQSTWDRYLLTYGLGEQLLLVSWIAESVARLTRRLELAHLLWLLVALAAGWLGREGLRQWRPRVAVRSPRRPPAAWAVERLRRRLERSGVALAAAASVRRIGRTAGDRWPVAAADALALVEIAELELYSREGAYRRVEVRRLWSRLRRATRINRLPAISLRRSPVANR
jgi:hypothetical protein